MKIAAAEPPAPMQGRAAGKLEKFSAPAPPEPVASLVVPARVMRRELAAPPVPRAPLVVVRQRAAQKELSELKALIPERALASAEGKPGARENLAELHQKISATEFEIGCNPAAREFAIPLDQAAAAAWSAEVQALEPADIVAGITRDQCAPQMPRWFRLRHQRRRSLGRTMLSPGPRGPAGTDPVSRKPEGRRGVCRRLRAAGHTEGFMTDTIVQPTAPPAPPANAQEARTRLDALIADKDRGALLLAGDPATNKDYRDLQNMVANVDPNDQVAVAMSGNIGEMPDSELRLMSNTADMLRDFGIREEIIADTLRGHEVTALEMKQVEAWRERAMRDQTFVRSWLSGDPEARQKMVLSQIIVSGGVKDAGGRF
jgi:hypothetical protein